MEWPGKIFLNDYKDVNDSDKHFTLKENVPSVSSINRIVRNKAAEKQKQSYQSYGPTIPMLMPPTNGEMPSFLQIPQQVCFYFQKTI